LGGAAAIINAQIRAQDLASQVVTAFANKTRTALGQINVAQSQLTRTFVDANKAYEVHIQRMQRYGQESERVGMSTGRLITMMVKFGIILKALQIATEPLRILSEGVKNLMEVDVRTREIMGMLADQTDTTATKISRYNNLVSTTIDLQRKFGFTAQDVGKGLYDVASVITTLDITGYAKDSTEAITKLTTDAATLARGGFMPLEEATSGLTTVFNALNIPVSNVNQVMDIMFNAVKIGKGHMADLTASMGNFLNTLGDLTTEGNKLQAFQETMGIFGYLTTVVSAPRAGTAVNRLLTGVAQRSTQQGILLSAIERDFAVDLTSTSFVQQGPRAYFEKLLGAVGPQSPQLSALIQSRTGQAPTEAQMIAVSTAILEQLTGDKRAATAMLALTRQDQFDKINPVMAQRGTAAMSEEQAMTAYQTRWDLFTQNIAAVGENLQMGILPKFMTFFDGVAKVLDETMSVEGFMDLSSGQKLDNIWQAINTKFTKWFNTGGKEEMRANAAELGGNAAAFFAQAFGVKLPGSLAGQKNAWFAAGGEIIGGMWQGFTNKMADIFSGRGIMESLGDIKDSPLVRGAATFFGLTKLGVPWPVALALSLSSAAATGTNLGPVGNFVGTAAPMLGATILMSRGIRGIPNAAVSLGNDLLIPQMISGGRGIWNAIPVPGGMPIGANSAWPRYGVYRGPGGRMVSGPPPGMMTSMGYMRPPIMGQYSAFNGPAYNPYTNNRPQQMGPPGPGFMRRTGSALGMAGASLEGGVGMLVMVAFQQVLETIMLIADNWDKFVYALKHGDLNNIPVFGALFAIVQRINDLWGLMFGKKETLAPSGSGPIDRNYSITAPQRDAYGREILAPNESMFKLDKNGNWVQVTHTGDINLHINMSPDSIDRNTKEFATRVYEAVVDVFSSEVGNSGKTAAGVIAP